MEATRSASTPQLATYARVALITDDPDSLQALAKALQEFAPGESPDVHVWLSVARFRAPSSTPPPYRSLAREEARSLTDERVGNARTAIEAIKHSWSRESAVHTEVLVDPAPAQLASLVSTHDVDLLVSNRTTGLSALFGSLGERVAKAAGRPLLSVDVESGRASLKPATGSKQPTESTQRLTVRSR